VAIYRAIAASCTGQVLYDLSCHVDVVKDAFHPFGWECFSSDFTERRRLSQGHSNRLVFRFERPPYAVRDEISVVL
jgi:hypothetical protein